jgi:hypothetical protein
MIFPAFDFGNIIFKPARIRIIGQNLKRYSQMLQGTTLVVFKRNNVPSNTRNIAPV